MVDVVLRPPNTKFTATTVLMHEKTQLFAETLTDCSMTHYYTSQCYSRFLLRVERRSYDIPQNMVYNQSRVHQAISNRLMEKYPTHTFHFKVVISL